MKLISTIFIFISLACAPVFGEGLSLAQLVDIALQNNPLTAKAWSNTKRAEAVVGIAKSSYYPWLDATGSANHGREVKFPNGPNTTYTFYSGELCLSYLLYDFGERSAAVQATKEALKAANWTADFTIQRIIYKVAASYYDYLNAEQVLQMKICSLQDAKLVLDAAEEMHQVGLRSKTDLSASKAQVAQVELELAQQRAKVAIAYGRLLTNMGLPVTNILQVETQAAPVENPAFSEGIRELIALADDQRADLSAKKATLSEMQQRVKVANRAQLPKLRALGEVGWLQYTRHKGNGYNYNTTLAVEFPVFRGFEFTYRKRLALADEEMTAAELTELQQEIAFEVLTYSESVKASQEALKWAGKYLEEAVDSYESAMESYRCGLHSIFDLVQSQRALADARIKKAEVATEWLVSLAQLAFATGSILK
jgi:outer membrane protein TolC